MNAVLQQLNSLVHPATPNTDKLTAMLADIRAASAERTAIDWLESAEKLREKMREEWLAFPERDDDDHDEVAA